MPLKVEIVQAVGDNPPFLIINDKETYPIKDISFRGKNNEVNLTVTQSFSFDTGLLFFVDIFDQPHCYVNYDEETKTINNVQNNFWF